MIVCSFHQIGIRDGIGMVVGHALLMVRVWEEKLVGGSSERSSMQVQGGTYAEVHRGVAGVDRMSRQRVVSTTVLSCAAGRFGH